MCSSEGNGSQGEPLKDRTDPWENCSCAGRDLTNTVPKLKSLLEETENDAEEGLKWESSF